MLKSAKRIAHQKPQISFKNNLNSLSVGIIWQLNWFILKSPVHTINHNDFFFLRPTLMTHFETKWMSLKCVCFRKKSLIYVNEHLHKWDWVRIIWFQVIFHKNTVSVWLQIKIIHSMHLPLFFEFIKSRSNAIVSPFHVSKNDHSTFFIVQANQYEHQMYDWCIESASTLRNLHKSCYFNRSMCFQRHTNWDEKKSDKQKMWINHSFHVDCVVLFSAVSFQFSKRIRKKYR